MVSQSFLTANAPDGGLLQSDEWARLQVASGRESFPFSGVGFEGHAFRYSLPALGNYLSIPRGPIIDLSGFASEELRAALSEIARSTGAAWIRIEPQADEVLAALRQAFGEQEVVPAPRDINPRETFTASLDGRLADWLSRMKPKVRYNVRLAEKHGVTVRFTRQPQDVETFLDLIASTASRKSIAPHQRSYYQSFFTALPENMCTLALAEHGDIPLAGALVVFFDRTAYYLHGGSSDLRRELMAPFLLHFKCMEEAKRCGMRRYDVGGVRIRTKRGVGDTDWDGSTRFKQGFAPDADPIVFPGTYDIIISPARYAIYRQSRRLAGLRRIFQSMLSHLPL